MASVEKITHVNAESEMEEGEIVDDLDDLSDVSSEEEFLLRQRLEVLEDYNNALERTKKKRTSGLIKPIRDYTYNRSQISAGEVNIKSFHSVKSSKYVKQYTKPKKKKYPVHKNVDVAYSKKKRDHGKKPNFTRNKPKLKFIRESSDESEDEYKNKRRKLEDAVVGYRGKTDTSSLSARLKKMLHTSEEPVKMDILNMYRNNKSQTNSLEMQFTPRYSMDEVDCGRLKNRTPKEKDEEKTLLEPIDILSSDDNDDDDVKVITNDNNQSTPVANVIVEPNPTKHETLREAESDSDEDLAQLRQQVLSTKALKAKPQEVEPETKVPSDDEDSDTAELRLICLKSTLLKRAIEMKQKQKLQKRRSQSTLEDDIFNEQVFFSSKIDSGNNTDIESMDMDIGSDADDKNKDANIENVRLKKTDADTRQHENSHTSAIKVLNKEEELEEDEDLLRAKLLTSLSKNLPHLVSPELLKTIDETKVSETTVQDAKSAQIPNEKRFIIKLDESDSEGEHEATKNLTKMHMKLAEQTDFQQQLDMLLKSTRMQVENAKLPDVVQKQATPKKPEKFVAKAVNHLPKSEQIEYKNLVKRMAELVKMKQLRQASINSTVQPLKETLKPSNIATETSLEERIALSRKKIADESSKMLKLKEEATKLSQRYKIVSTELHNISTAITLNKKQQRAVHNCLSKIRHQHQTLIKSSSISLHSKVNGRFNSFTSNATATKLQKENSPKDEYKNVIVQKTVKISIANDFNKNVTNTTNPRLCVEVDIANNEKVVTMPGPVMDKRLVEITETLEKQITDISNTLAKESYDITNTGGRIKQEINNECENLRHIVSDYKSPLDCLAESWKWDPNAILCPFDVAGQCKDSDCEYLHILFEQ